MKIDLKTPPSVKVRWDVSTRAGARLHVSAQSWYAAVSLGAQVTGMPREELTAALCSCPKPMEAK